MADRKLATVETVAQISPIENADAIELATVRGWHVVIRKGECAVGDKVIYFEIDSMLPIDHPAFAFLAPRGTKKVTEGDRTREVHVLRTAKLRGQISQGLLIPASSPDLGFDASMLEVGTDVAHRFGEFGITKWEPPLPAMPAGETIGPFPTSVIMKTDAERVQNLVEEFAGLKAAGEWIATEKIDGTSVTIFNDGTLRICTRNWELKLDDALDQVSAATAQGIVPDVGWAFQAELFGEGIQANPLGIKGRRLWCSMCCVGRGRAGRCRVGRNWVVRSRAGKAVQAATLCRWLAPTGRPPCSKVRPRCWM